MSEAGHQAGLDELHRPLVDRLELTTSLSRAEVTRVIGDVLDYFGESATELVKRRHRELRARHLTNPAVFASLHEELPMHRVRAPDLSLRQLRRIVYG